jgi:uncharacterized protein YjdB
VQGDQLIATSGIVYNKESEYGEVKVKMGQQVVRLKVMGEVSKQQQQLAHNSGWCGLDVNAAHTSH